MSKELVPGVNCGWIKEGFWENLQEEQDRRKVRRSSPSLNIEYMKFFEEMSKPENDLQELLVGSIIKGKVVGISKKEIVIDIKHKDYVYVDTKSTLDLKIVENFRIGEEIEVLIVEVQDSPYMIRGSVTELLRLSIDGTMRDCFKNNTVLTGKVTDLIPAGYVVDLSVNNLVVSAFMPNTLADVNRLSIATSIVGETIQVCLETLQQDRGAYVVSRKKYLETLIPEKLKSLKRNKVYNGFVTGTTPFGVFVQFEDCLTGMIHKANINEKYRENFQTAKSGTLIEFYVKDIIKGSNKIILTQILRDSLWDTLKLGQIFKGKVISVKHFGTLVSLDEETLGLLQSSYLTKINRNLTAGDEVEVRISSIMKDDRKLYLTFADDESWKDREKKKYDDLKTKFNSDSE